VDVSLVQGRRTAAPAWIALDFLDRTGEIDDPGEACRFLVGKVESMMAQGQRNRLLLANRAIAAYQSYRRARTVELSLVS